MPVWPSSTKVARAGGESPAPGVAETVSGGRAASTLLAYAVVTAVIAAWCHHRRDVA